MVLTMEKSRLTHGSPTGSGLEESDNGETKRRSIDQSKNPVKNGTVVF
jgi:hypothetical protein